MPRSQNNVASRTRKKRVLKKAKGFWGSRGTLISIAKHAVDKAGQYAFRDRRVKKRTFRSLWITRINAAARLNGLTYSTLMAGMKVKGIEINRKVLAELAVSDLKTFSKIANLVNVEK